MFKKILLAYDGSDHSRKAALLAADMAREHPGEVVVSLVTVMEKSPREMGESYLSQIIEKRTEIGLNNLKEAVELLGTGFEIQENLLFGDAAQTIIQTAHTQGCDLIVMGTRGLGLLQGLLVGSQANKVVSLSECPVLLVK